jgi:hypothetical protein
MKYVKVGDEIDASLRTFVFGNAFIHKEHNFTISVMNEKAFIGVSTVDGSVSEISYDRITRINGMDVKRYISTCK